MYYISEEAYNQYNQIIKNEGDTEGKFVNIGQFVVWFARIGCSPEVFTMAVTHNGNNILLENAEGIKLADKVFEKLDFMLEDYLARRSALIDETFFGVERCVR